VLVKFLFLKDNVAVVTGATGALGRTVAKALLENGVYVVSTYRSEEKQKELVTFLGELKENLMGVKTDVTNEKSVQNLLHMTIEKYGHVDILLNIVGGYLGGEDLVNTTESDWDYMMNTNLKSAFLCSKGALPHMIRQNYGRIVNVAARPAVEKRYRVKSGAYAISKAGVLILTEALAEEVKKYDINVNCILPSTIDTPNNRRSFPNADSSKWVKPEDVAKVILFLVSDDSKITSGASITVYGKA